VSSGARGVTITATVVGKATVTDSISIVIGGTAGSVVIGQSTTIESSEDGTSYKLPMTAQVVDSNGNPVPSARISLKLWPLSYRTGIWVPQTVGTTNTNCIPEVSNTYPNEDDTFPGTSYYRNLILDPGEDANGDGQLTPSSSSAGAVPDEVVADENGMGAFYLTYTKSQAAWIVAEITGSTLVLGSESRSTSTFVLPWSITDSGACLLPDSPYNNSQPTLEITLTATPDEVYPDGGTSTSSIRAQVTQLGSAVADGTLVSFAITSGIGGLGGATSSESSASTTAGQASVIYYSGDRPGDVTITATLADGTTATVDLKLTRGAGEPFTIALSAEPTELAADGGTSTSIVRADVQDSESYPIADGTTITFAITEGSGAFGSATGSPETTETTTAGIASVTYYSGSVPGAITIRAQAENGTVKEEALIELVEATGGSMTLVAAPSTVTTVGGSSVITATIVDTAGKPVPQGTSVTFSVTADAKFENGALTYTLTTPSQTGIVKVSLIITTTTDPSTIIVTAVAGTGASQAVTVTYDTP